MKLGFAILILSFAFIAKAGVEVWGTLEYRQYPANGSTQMLVQRAFHAQVDGCRWSMVSTNIHPTREEPFTFFQVANDEENIYTTRAYDPFKVPGAFKNPKSKFITNSVTISRGWVPESQMEFSSAIWLGYASDCQLSMKTNGRMANFLSSSSSAHIDIRPFTIRRESNCIRQLVFYNEGRFPNGPIEQLSYKPAKPPFDKGFIEWKFSVAETITIGTNCIPKKFLISYFTTKASAQDENDTRKASEVQVIASRVSLMDSVLPLPTLLDRFSAVYDERMRDQTGRPTEYLTSGSVFPTNSTMFRDARNRSGVNAPFERGTP